MIFSNILLQINMPTADGAVEAETLGQVQEVAAQEGISFWEMALNGGWLMIPLLLLSIIAIYIFVERYIVITKASKDAPYFMDRIREFLADGKTDAAIKVCKQTKAPYAAMIEKGIMRIGRPAADIQSAIENVGNLQVGSSALLLVWYEHFMTWQVLEIMPISLFFQVVFIRRLLLRWQDLSLVS